MPLRGMVQRRSLRDASTVECSGASCHGLLALATGGGSLVLAAALLAQPAPPPGGAVVLTGGRIIDGTGGPPLARAALLIADGRIRAVGPAADVPLPDDATRVDVTGKTIIPGLISAHAHLNDGDEALPLRERLPAQLRVYAGFGVTTVHTLGDGRSAAHRADAPRQPYPWRMAEESVRVRDEQARGNLLDRARLFPSGPNVVGASEAEARAGVDQVAELGVDVVKTRLDDRPDDMGPAVYRALIDQAHRRGLRVAAHGRHAGRREGAGGRRRGRHRAQRARPGRRHGADRGVDESVVGGPRGKRGRGRAQRTTGRAPWTAAG